MFSEACSVQFRFLQVSFFFWTFVLSRPLDKRVLGWSAFFLTHIAP